MKRIAIFFLFFLLPALCLAGEKVYTNADLKPPPPNKSTSYNSDGNQTQRHVSPSKEGRGFVEQSDPSFPKDVTNPQLPQPPGNTSPPSDMNRIPSKAVNPVNPFSGPQQSTFEQRMANAFARVTLFMLIVIGIPFLIWLICLIDVLRNEFTGNNKIIWFLVVFFLPVIGSILYFFIGTDQKKKPEDDKDQ
jgi:hypothetical protein